MTRRTLSLFVGLFLSCGVASADVGVPPADLEGEKLKEKQEKKLQPALDGEDHAREHSNLLKQGEENLKEINRLLEEIQNNLSQKNTGKATQEKQAAAVKRMEELIKQLSKG